MPLIIPGNRQASTGYTIGQSIRFNDDDTAYMHRTPSSSGNRDKWTWSSWIKRGNLTDANATLFQAGDDSQSANYTTILFNGNSGGEPTLKFNSVIGSATKLNLATTQYFRDVSAWYHIVCVYDSGNDVSTERARIYVNGSRVTDLGTTTYPDQNQDSMTNHTVKQSIGRRNQDTSRYMDGYMAEIHLLDGYAYDPSFFGEFNDSGIWIPKEYTGSYGTNGFKIDGRDSSDLGDDESGQGNDYTTSGLAAHDQVLDTPTNNFCTGLPTGVGNATGVTFSEGNLTGKTSGTAGNWVSSIPVDSGKWYFEVNNHAQGSGNNLGIGQTPSGSYHHFASGSGGNQINDYDIVVNTGASGSIVGFKLDFDAGTLTHTTDGTSYSSTGSLTSGMAYAAFARLGSSSGHVAFNFGQDSTFGGLETAGGNSDSNGIGDFYYNVPSGFKAICTKNLGS